MNPFGSRTVNVLPNLKFVPMNLKFAPNLTINAFNGDHDSRSSPRRSAQRRPGQRPPVWRDQMSRASCFALGSAFTVGSVYARSRYLRWGATAEDVQIALPGDGLLRRCDVSATRAISIAVPPVAVWPWLVQLGQGRGGFYSYDSLENLFGLNIHSAANVVPEWQSLDIGSAVDFAPGVGLRVAELQPQQALVLRGGLPIAGPSPYDFTWAFVLRPGPGEGTRLIVRERYAYLSWWAPLMVEPVEVVSFVMSQKMLRGIRDRAEHAAAAAELVL